MSIKILAMYKILLLILFSLSSFISLQADNDTIVINEKDYSTADKLDSLLMDWYSYTNRDTTSFISLAERDLFVTDIPDSVYKERIENIVTPLELVYNQKVQSYLNRYIKNGKWVAPKFIGLSYKYFPMFEEKLDQYNMPIELKYLAIIESALNPKARSRAGATGLWQFMYRTGRHMGLEINSYIDERMDPYKSTDAACRYLKSLHEIYNDWFLAIAAYNAGPGNVNKAIRRSGGKRNYWEIYPYLPNETRNYIPGLIAIIYMFEYADEHKYKPEKIHFYEDIDTVMVRKNLHFAQLDSVLGIDVAETRELNPQYKLDIIPAKTKQYPLCIRQKYISQFIMYEDSIYNFKDSVFFSPKTNNLKTTAKYTESAPTASQPKGTAELTYSVKSGDVVGLIAEWYDITSAQLRAWNGLYGNKIKIGQNLKIYVPKESISKYKNINSLSYDEKQKLEGKTPNENKTTETSIDPSYIYHTVKSGDSPYELSLKYNVPLEEILNLNNITNPSGLKIGQKLKIRKK